MNTANYNFNIVRLLLLIGFVFIMSTIYTQSKHPYASDQPMHEPKKFEIPGVNSAWHITFEPDGNTFYFVTGGDSMEVVYYSHFENGKWSTPEQTKFSGKYRIETPSISPDGKKFFFAKAIVQDNQGKDDIYVLDKTESGWSEPKILDSPVNTQYFDASPSCASSGNLYFFSTRDGSLHLYCSKLENGKYSSPEALDEINSRINPGELCISPDESYILFNANSNQKYQLYVSFNQNGTWTKPQNLGARINFNNYQGRPCISPDGKYLFYTSGSSRDWVMSQYQVDINPILDSLKYNVEISAVMGRDKTIELPTLIVFNEKEVKVKFSETPSWLQPYIKNKGNDNKVINKINIDGLKSGIYESRVKLTAVDNPVKEYSYLVRLNVLERCPALPVKDLQKGIKYEYYEDTSFTMIPDFTKMKPQKTGIAKNIDISIKNRDTLYAIVYDGYIDIPQSSLYTFFLTSDDGSRFHIDDKLCIDNDGLHGPMEKSEDCYLEKGIHKIKIEFIQGGMGAALGLFYEAREIGIKKKAFSSDELFH